MCGIIYVITNTVNGKQYVGQTTLTLKRRWGWPLKPKNKYHSSCVIDSAIRKYGAESFTIEQIDTAESQDELDKKEIYHVAQHRTVVPEGYNLTIGGKGGNGWVMPKEARKRISEALTGHPGYWLGKRHSEETRERMAKSAKGRIFSEETCRKISEANRARPKKEFCRRGHPFDLVNTYVHPSGKRVCLTCHHFSRGGKVPERLQCYLNP